MVGNVFSLVKWKSTLLISLISPPTISNQLINFKLLDIKFKIYFPFIAETIIYPDTEFMGFRRFGSIV